MNSFYDYDNENDEQGIYEEARRDQALRKLFPRFFKDVERAPYLPPIKEEVEEDSIPVAESNWAASFTRQKPLAPSPAVAPTTPAAQPPFGFYGRQTGWGGQTANGAYTAPSDSLQANDTHRNDTITYYHDKVNNLAYRHPDEFGLREECKVAPQAVTHDDDGHFDYALNFVFEHEGEYNNDNRYDRGGKTNYGITNDFKKEYSPLVPDWEDKPIEKLTSEDARKLYKAQWERYEMKEIQDKYVAVLLYDYMVNSYDGAVIKRLKELLYDAYKDIPEKDLKTYRMTPATMDAINSCTALEFAEMILPERKHYYDKQVRNEDEKRDRGENYKDQRPNYKGWMNRLNHLAEMVGSDLRFPTVYIEKNYDEYEK